ncbi:MAG: helix-turn-helix transcriptional regulator [Aquabacterium commune]|uniref:helix-turn-helix domain-containing protein n=1 Tax=Aquabacterium TaxID=92793 RepID=UPI001DC459C5|nr:helix-turn-helix transcriptional regulator [Aquabacterium sp.]MBT9608710.1 helix-turn-helix transcriptional regulator [Aquabacterium sp.]
MALGSVLGIQHLPMIRPAMRARQLPGRSLKRAHVRRDTAAMTCAENTSIRHGETLPFGQLLRQWRSLRKRAQLDVALEAGVSQRHLSFLESSRAQPSRDMVLQLAEVLDVPLRERNLWLHAAGFAPMFQQRALQDDDMVAVREALTLTIKHHEPYPAMVVNRQWDMLMSNAPAERFVALLGQPDEVWQRVDESGGRNVMRMTFHPQGMQPRLKNWPQVATLLLNRLHRELAADPTHQALRQLLADVSHFPGVSAPWRSQHWLSGSPPPIFPMEYDLGEHTLKVFSMVSSFGTALDVTADELRVETFFPADEFSRNFFHMLSA